jgi:hypothetical protein
MPICSHGACVMDCVYVCLCVCVRVCVSTREDMNDLCECLCGVYGKDGICVCCVYRLCV